MSWARLVAVVLMGWGLSLAVGAQGDGLDPFRARLRAVGLTFTMPPGFVEAPVLKNPDAAYQFAIRSSTRKLEVRYFVLALKDQVEAYRRSKKPGSREVCAEPNHLFEALLKVNAANISGRPPGEIAYKPFATQDVRAEFGADAGGTCAVQLQSEFGKGYVLCCLNVYHRTNVADLIVFCLADDLDNLRDGYLENDAAIHALRFKRK